MSFELIFSAEAKEKLRELKYSRNLGKRYKAVLNALDKLSQNPRYPSLQTHEYESIFGPNGEKVFEAYAENNTPKAYRVFFYYGPDKNYLTIYTILPHP
jgi:mRNA-degrading endonuclease RelE of RelBE toxin-antitoxin system